jgi:hypothetical protein
MKRWEVYKRKRCLSVLRLDLDDCLQGLQKLYSGFLVIVLIFRTWNLVNMEYVLITARRRLLIIFVNYPEHVFIWKKDQKLGWGGYFREDWILCPHHLLCGWQYCSFQVPSQLRRPFLSHAPCAAAVCSMEVDIILDLKFRRVLNVLCFLMGNSRASEFYMLTFWNTLFRLHRQVGVKNSSHLPAYEDGTDSVIRNVGI